MCEYDTTLYEVEKEILKKEIEISIRKYFIKYEDNAIKIKEEMAEMIEKIIKEEQEGKYGI